MPTRGTLSQWSALVLLVAICGVISSDPEFVALVNPCRNQDVICPVNCSIMKMSGSTNCEFCFCKNPLDSVAWPDPTTTTERPTTPRTTTLPPGHYFVNNVHYVELKNPCVLSNAMCPVTCRRGNITMATGTTCEKCECPDMHHRLDGEQSIVVGRREVMSERLTPSDEMPREQPFYPYRQQMPVQPVPQRMYHEFWNRPCMPFFTCPILSCPHGQHMPVQQNGCRICQCVEDHHPVQITQNPSTTTKVTAPPSTIDPANFLEMFCLPRADDCPSSCHVTNYRVDNWNCYHCSCPEGQTFIALQHPCDVTAYVCPSKCSIRNTETSSDPTSTCQLCDCTNISPAGGIIRRFLVGDFGPGPGHNSHVAYSGPVQGGNGFDNNKYIQDGFNYINSKPQETTSQLPVNTRMTTPMTPTGPVSTEDPESLCLTNQEDCPVQICRLQTIGHSCHLCLCGDIYFRDSDVEKFHILHKTTTSKLPATSTVTSSSISTTAPSTAIPTTHAHSTASSSTSRPTTTPPTTISSTRVRSTKIISTGASSVIVPVTKVTQLPVSVTTTTVSKSCYKCNETNCKQSDLDACAPGMDYCMNTIIQDKNGLREFRRECVGEKECYDKWWIQSMNNPVCLGMYNKDKGPADQPEVCYFCCKGPSCNRAARIEDYNLYTGDDHVIG